MATGFTKSDLQIHFVLRYSDTLKGYDTIAEHERILKQRGHVWMGKFGMGVSSALVAKTMAQIAEGVPTWVYFSCQKKITRRAMVRRMIGGGHGSKSKTPSLATTPRYYSAQACSVWFELTTIEECSPSDISLLRLYNDPSMAPAFTSMRGLFYVTQARSETEPVRRTKQARSGRGSPTTGDNSTIDTDFDDLGY